MLEHNNDKAPNGSFGIINIHSEVLNNDNFRKEVWTGKYLQITVMSIPAGGEIGLEMHDNLDQFIKVERGCAHVYMGKSKKEMKYIGKASANDGIIVPNGTWHNVINACTCTLKVYSIYAPPNHTKGTIHQSKLDADLAED